MTKDGASTTICPACGAKTSGKFCDQCGAGLVTSGCRGCGASLVRGARFCNACGTPVVADGSAPRASGGAGIPPRASMLPWGLAAILLVGVSAYFVGQQGDSAPASAPMGAAPFADGAASGGAAPDISSMSPRERAGRLYDRIMRYVEQGKRDSAAFFAPMAMASFEMLGSELDADGRYDFGRVASETGNLDIASAQADTILRTAPTHLLGLSLKARTATARGNTALAQTTWKQFLASRDAELLKKLPEYEAHASDIALSTQLATGAK